LVLLHGVGTSSGEWSWVLPDLARNNLVYAIDLPGYDGSYEPPDYSPAYTASFVSSFLDAVGVERAVIVGNSFGGLVALHLALSHPARVSALVLSDSAGLGQAVNPALVALNSPAGGELAKTLGTRRASVPPRGLSSVHCCSSGAPGGYVGSGSRTNTSWRSCPTLRTRRLVPCATPST
jgi:pimeloyl-ACP methyl ester carboxylesterase